MATAAAEWAEYLDTLRKSGDSVGRDHRGHGAGRACGPRRADLRASSTPIWPPPPCRSMPSRASRSAMAMATAALTGSQNADEIAMGEDGPVYASNHAGGILGGISTGQDIVLRFAVKPTSSILTPRKTITKSGEATDIVTKGRHDPLRWHPRGAGGRGDDGLRPARSPAAASRTCGRKPRPYRLGGFLPRPQIGRGQITGVSNSRRIRFALSPVGRT